MLSNAYFLAKFRFDTAENEPAKNLQIFEKCIFEKCIFEKCIRALDRALGAPSGSSARERSTRGGRRHELPLVLPLRKVLRGDLPAFEPVRAKFQNSNILHI